MMSDAWLGKVRLTKKAKSWNPLFIQPGALKSLDILLMMIHLLAKGLGLPGWNLQLFYCRQSCAQFSSRISRERWTFFFCWDLWKAAWQRKLCAESEQHPCLGPTGWKTLEHLESFRFMVRTWRLNWWLGAIYRDNRGKTQCGCVWLKRIILDEIVDDHQKKLMHFIISKSWCKYCIK